MNEIITPIVRCFGFSIIGVAIVIALLRRSRKNQRWKINESRSNYHCLTCKMAWATYDDAVDDSVQPAGGLEARI